MSMLDAYNYSLLSVPAMWLLGIGTHFSAIALTSRSKELPKFDNVAPRQFMAEVSKLTKTSAVRRDLSPAAPARSRRAPPSVGPS